MWRRWLGEISLVGKKGLVCEDCLALKGVISRVL